MELALKVVRNKPEFKRAAKAELEILRQIHAEDREQNSCCIHVEACFEINQHVCLVFRALGPSVFDRLEGNGFMPYPIGQVRHIVRQLLTAIQFLQVGPDNTSRMIMFVE